ncbi:hypothetical protein KFK09_028405 [Dendrobium nobile]|uniref:Uncharacterized protein n=1 Tax=Dendrobium nobile TaxID=94219 RepID=A0A8T3A2E3_DENNO|nr:hypothetical protein KFK09_028405 [Dendrobium nobile]
MPLTDPNSLLSSEPISPSSTSVRRVQLLSSSRKPPPISSTVRMKPTVSLSHSRLAVREMAPTLRLFLSRQFTEQNRSSLQFISDRTAPSPMV